MSSERKRRPFWDYEQKLLLFTDVRIPYKLNKMSIHKRNIEQAFACGDDKTLQKEQEFAKTLLDDLKRDLIDAQSLRDQIVEDEVALFDNAFEDTLRIAMREMKKFVLDPSCHLLPSNHENCDGNRNENLENPLMRDSSIQKFESRKSILDEDEEKFVRAWEHLQLDAEGLLECQKMLQELVKEQDPMVESIDMNVNSAVESVQEGNEYLKRSLLYRTAKFPVLGAAIGLCVGGPLGLIIGLKTASLAGVGGGILGFFGGKAVKNNLKEKVEKTSISRKEQ